MLTCKAASGRATSTATRTTSGTIVLTSLLGAGRGAPLQTDAAESEQMEMVVVDNEDKE